MEAERKRGHEEIPTERFPPLEVLPARNAQQQAPESEACPILRLNAGKPQQLQFHTQTQLGTH